MARAGQRQQAAIDPPGHLCQRVIAHDLLVPARLCTMVASIVVILAEKLIAPQFPQLVAFPNGFTEYIALQPVERQPARRRPLWLDRLYRRDLQPKPTRQRGQLLRCEQAML